MKMSGTASVSSNTALTLSERLSAEARVPASDRRGVRLVHVRSASFPLNRCVACDRQLATGDPGYDANFPLSTPECAVLIRARVCALCLGNPGVAAPEGVRRMVLAIFEHLGEWYAVRDSDRQLRAFPTGATARMHALPLTSRRSRFAESALRLNRSVAKLATGAARVRDTT
jgi:hypothetical protein